MTPLALSNDLAKGPYGSFYRNDKHDGQTAVIRMCQMTVLPFALRSAIKLGIPDILKEAGPHVHLTAEEIASRIATPAGTPADPENLHRFLRLLASHNVVTAIVTVSPKDPKVMETRYGITPTMECLTSSDGGIFAAFLLAHTSSQLVSTLEYLHETVLDRNAQPSDFAHAKGISESIPTEYALDKLFNKAVGDSSRVLMSLLLQDYRGFEGLSSLEDVGGATGVDLALILSKYPQQSDIPRMRKGLQLPSGTGDFFGANPDADAVFVKDQESKKRSHDEVLSQITGKHIIYSYENGWVYEVYFKNITTIDYRIHSGLVARRWVKNQKVNVVQLSGKERYKISWCEPTGTAVSLCINFDTLQHHGVIFFPQWVHQQGAKTAVFQNDHLEEMMRLRDAGPTYPIDVVDEFAELVLVEDAGVDDEQIISISPTEFASTLEHICEKNSLAHKLAHFGESWGSRDTSDLVGKHLAFTYHNGWQHELCVRSLSSIDYKVHTRLETAWHSVKGQEAFIVRLTGSERYIISWTEVSGMSVSLTLDLAMQELHGVHFCPQQVLKDTKELSLCVPENSPHPHSSSLPQNGESNVDPVTPYGDAGPIYPLQLVSEFAQISSVRNCESEF